MASKRHGEPIEHLIAAENSMLNPRSTPRTTLVFSYIHTRTHIHLPSQSFHASYWKSWSTGVPIGGRTLCAFLCGTVQQPLWTKSPGNIIMPLWIRWNVCTSLPPRHPRHYILQTFILDEQLVRLLVSLLKIRLLMLLYSDDRIIPAKFVKNRRREDTFIIWRDRAKGKLW